MDAPAVTSTLLRFGLFEADVARGRLTRAGVRVKIQDQPFRVLVLLLGRAGEIVSREEFRQALWSEGTFVDFDGSLNVILKKLRAAIDDDSENPRFIETIPRRGYRFIAPVSTVETKPGPAIEEVVFEASAITNVQTAAPASSSYRRYRPVHLIYLILILVAIVATGVFLWQRRRPTSAARLSDSSQAPVSVRKSVAVLGFRNVSSQANDAWLSPALSEMLSTELAGGEKLRMVSGEDVANLRVASPWAQTDTLDVATTTRLGTALSSDLLVLGSYAIIGGSDRGRLRLDVRLQDAKTGDILTEIAEIGNARDVFPMVSRVGSKLRDRLGVPQLENPEEAGVLASVSSNEEAEKFYYLGLFKLREFDYLSARDLFEQATKADPKFPLAYSMLSRADIFLGHDNLARAEAKRGLDLSGNLSRVQRMQIEASFYHANADRDKAAEIYRALFSLFPDSLDYGLQLAKLQNESYHPDEALETLRQLRRLPSPAKDDPALDLREAGIRLPTDSNAAGVLFHRAAEKASAQGRKLLYATAERSLCWLNEKRLQNPPECREAFEIFMAAGNHAQAADCLQLMAEANRQTGHPVEAVPLYEQGLRIVQNQGSREETGVILNNLSLVLESEGQWNRAEESYRKARQNFEAVNDWANSSEAISNIANIEVMRGHFRRSEAMYRQAWELAESSHRTRPELAHIQHSALNLMTGHVQAAQQEIEAQVKSLRTYAGDPWELANAIAVLGDVLKSKGELESARKSYQEAIEILQKANAPRAIVQVQLADLSTADGHPEVAEPELRSVIAEFEKDKRTGDEVGGYTSLARALLALGKLEEAKSAIERGFNLTDLSEFPMLSGPLQVLRAQVEAASHKSTSAGSANTAVFERQLNAISQRSHEMGFYRLECEARLALGEMELKANRNSGRTRLTALSAETRSHGFELLARHADQALADAKNVQER